MDVDLLGWCIINTYCLWFQFNIIMIRKVLTCFFIAVSLVFVGSSASGQNDGFKQIFDGKSLDGWSGNQDVWKVEDGILIGETTTQRPLKKNTFLVWQGGEPSDFELRFEFRVSGKGSNSGIQFRCAQEDSGQLAGYQADIDLAGKWLGSIYDENTSRKSLCDRGEKIAIDEQGKRSKETIGDKEALFQQLDMSDFNEYSIKAIGNHITISINGDIVAELHDIEKGHADLSGVLGLQVHSGPPMKIEFKDIRLKQIEVETDPAGFESIFDGKTLDGWTGDTNLWRIEDGAIVGQTTKEIKIKANQFLVWDQGEVDDFSLKLKFRLSGTQRANSGVQYRSKTIDGDKHRLSGYQADIDKSGKYIGITYSERTGRGILCQRGNKTTIRGPKDKLIEKIADPAELLKGIDLDGWNEMDVIARGSHLVTKINGNVTSEVIDQDQSGYISRGLIGFQLHVGPPMKIEFKDVKLKRIKNAAPAESSKTRKATQKLE